jgi:uroporphyrinogen-III decarboxylase
MTKEERLSAAVKLQTPDRIPVVPLIGQWIMPYKKLPRGLRYKDPQKLMDAFYEAYNELGGYDAQYVAGLAWPQSSWRISGPSGTMVSAGKRGIPENFSVQYEEKETLHFEDYDKIINRGWNAFLEEYIPREMHTTPAALDEAEKALIRYYVEDTGRWRERGVPVMCGALIISCEMTLSLGRTLPQFTLDLYRHPDKVLAALEALVPDFIQNAIDDVKASGVPWVNISLERGSGSYYNLNIYEKFFFPQLKKIVDALVNAGNIVVMHMDTNWTRNLPYLRELPRVSCICELDSTTDIFKAKEILKDHMCIMGDVSAATLSLGTPEETTAYCNKLIDVIGKDGGFILSTGCETPIDAQFVNMRAMIDSVKNHP